MALDRVSLRTHRIATMSGSIRSSVLQSVTCSQHSSNAMADVKDVNTRQRMVNELLTAEGSIPVQIRRRLRSMYGEDAVDSVQLHAGPDVLIAVKRTLVTALQWSTSHGNDDGDKR